MESKEVGIRALLKATSYEVRIIVSKVIDLENAKLHMKNPIGIKEEIADLVREVIKQ
jgi:hypothetical protein